VKVAALCGGVGAARLLRGLVRALDPHDLVAIANVGDDCDLHGLAISPDLDTITYTVSGSVNQETGWGLTGETWEAMGALARFASVVPSGSAAGSTWFGLGDRDLATHLYRTGRRHEGAPLSEITGEIARAFGLDFTLVPVTDDPLRTRVVVDGDELDFQSWFVGRRHEGRVSRVSFDGADAARPAPGVLEVLVAADRIVVCPSNPLVSIAPVLAVPAVGAAVAARREAVVAVSPIVGGDALKGPAATMLRDLGHDVSPVGVARLLSRYVGTLVVDDVDAALAPAVEAEGVRCVVAPSIMSDVAAAEALARVTLS
jgi:LPPG:FO 2-phospho-L-lactate transferase